jgi:hypothetical protein
MALVKDQNSYATVEEADAYFENRIDVAAWTDALPTQKEQALVTATSIIDSMQWTGYVVSETQPLAFPRVGTYFDPRIGYVVELPPGVPPRIVQATYETAYHLLNNDGLLDNTGTVEDLTVGSITLTKIVNPTALPSAANRLVQPLLVTGVGGPGGNSSGIGGDGTNRMWWRAN